VISQLVVATHNPDKLREIQNKLGGLSIKLLSLAENPSLREVEEDLPDLLGNAIKKAVETARATGLPALADDTGLEVEALRGAPGVLSARYSGPAATYDSNCQKLLDELQNVPEGMRQAHFRTVICLRASDGLYCVEGVLDGTIGFEKRGARGFGYDPVFVLPDGRTLAELELSEKNRVSHRAQALEKLAKLMTALVPNP
jgi:XTP/dITP diphosphohydrolase